MTPVVEEEEDQLVKATKAAEELYELRDTYFPTDPNEKNAQLLSQSDFALKLLDSIPLERRKDPDQEAMYEYLRGKILHIVPNYREEAADHLFKAVKLNPNLVDAWFCLGNCTWRKGDLYMAKFCFTFALNKGRDKKILCQLSTLSRHMARGMLMPIKFLSSLDFENKALHAEESIQYAREAITLDVQYGKSWYNLGTAYLFSFFATGSVHRSKLTQSLKALKNAEKDELFKSHPEIYCLTSTAHKYLEDFEKALIGFEAAFALRPRHNVSKNIQDIINLLETLVSVLKKHVTITKLSSVASDQAYINLKVSYRIVTIDTLSEGLNKRVAVMTKVLSLIKHDSAPPMYYLICDSDKEYFALSVLRAQYDMIRTGDELIILEPFYYQYDFSWKGKEYKFKSIRLDFFNQLLVNGILLFLHEEHVPASIHT